MLILEVFQMMSVSRSRINKRKEAGLATRPSPVFEQLLLSYCSVTQPLVALVLRDNFVQLKDR